MGKIELDHTGAGGGVTLSSDGTDLLQDNMVRLIAFWFKYFVQLVQVQLCLAFNVFIDRHVMHLDAVAVGPVECNRTVKPGSIPTKTVIPGLGS